MKTHIRSALIVGVFTGWMAGIVLAANIARCEVTASAAISAPSIPVSLPRHVEIPLGRETIQVDGRLDEPAWRSAAPLSPLYRNDGNGEETESTQLLLFYDSEALYIAWLCHDADIQATFRNRDDELWEEEVVEMFITPGELTRYFELQWNPLGTIFDAIIKNQLDRNGLSKSIQGEWGWTAEGMQSAVQVEGTVQNPNQPDTSWTVEIRLPFSALGCPAPQPGDVWRGNFYRYNRTTGRDQELCAWSPTLLPSFHQPSRFGYLEFKPQSNLEKDRTEFK